MKQYIEENLCKELNLMMVQVPLIVDKESGVNDMLDRDGSRTPVEFPCGLGLDEPLKEAFAKGKPILGICIGCQVIFSHSEEDGGTDCLGLLEGEVRHFGKPLLTADVDAVR